MSNRINFCTDLQTLPYDSVLSIFIMFGVGDGALNSCGRDRGRWCVWYMYFLSPCDCALIILEMLKERDFD
jgi:hypothetical protein